MSLFTKVAVFFSVALLSVTASATVPTAATDAITAVQTDGTALIDAGWPVAAALVGGLILIKLFKKVMSKVS